MSSASYAAGRVKARGVTLGFRFVGARPTGLAAFLKSETAKWAEMAKHADLAAH